MVGIILPVISITIGIIGIAVKIYLAKRKKNNTVPNNSFNYHKDNVYYPR